MCTLYPSCLLPSATLNTCSMAGNIASIVSSAPRGDPGRVITKVFFMNPATPLDSIANEVLCCP